MAISRLFWIEKVIIDRENRELVKKLHNVYNSPSLKQIQKNDVTVHGFRGSGLVRQASDRSEPLICEI